MEWNGVGGTMSQLSDKILSYAVETYLPMHSAVSVNPEMYGTFLPTATPYMTTATTLPVYQSAVNPPGGEGGSWLFTTPSTGSASRIRFNQTNYNNQKIWDGQYGFGIWIKINAIPVGTTTGVYGLFATARSSGFPGFSGVLRGTSHTSGTGIQINLFSGSFTAITNPVIGKWYYIVGRKNRLTNGATVWVDGVKVGTGSNTNFVEPVTSTETAYPITFEAPNASTAAAGLSYNLCHAHLMDFTTFTDDAITGIYTAGSTAPILNNLTYWDGTNWTVPTNKYQWDGVNWITMTGKYWNGSSWTNLT